MKWTKRQHRGWREIEESERMGMHNLHLRTLLPRWQYLSGEYSIISPCGATMNDWEAYNGKDIRRFKTLKEAKAYCEADNDF